MRVSGKELDVELSGAIVLQVNKYSGTGIFTDDKFFPLTQNTMHTNIVFQLKDTNKTLPLDVRDVYVPAYDKQEVDIIRVNKSIVGYVDVKNEEYYYLTNDFCKAIGAGIPSFFVWLAGLIGAIIVYNLISSDRDIWYITLPLFLAWLFYMISKLILNPKIEKAIDEYMQTASVF